MRTTMMARERVREETVKWVWPCPLTFAEFLELPFGAEDYVELIDGVVVEKPMVPLEHEKLLSFLYHLIGLYVEEKNLGLVLGSRTAVEISPFRGRLPDLVFVRRERLDIVQRKAILGAPDLIIEIVSPNDRRSDLHALETDYRAIGVPEIVFINQPKSKVRVLRKRENDYVAEERKTGALRLETLEGIEIETGWLFTEPRPNVRPTLARLLGEQPE